MYSVDVVSAYIVLSKSNIPVYTAIMSFHPNMFSLCIGGIKETRSHKRLVACPKTHFALSSVGR